MQTGGGTMLRQVPRLTILLMLGPVLAGLWGTVQPALTGGATGPLAQLLDWPGLGAAVRLSAVTGIGATLVSLLLVLSLTATLYGTATFRRIERLLAPFLSLPHAAAALGLAFLVAPSGWIARLLAQPFDWQDPPDLLVLNDPLGLSLMLGLVTKEVPFLLLMTLAALPQTDAARRLTVGQSLGYGQVTGFAMAVVPALYRQLRLPVYAVLAYSMTAVEMGLILGPTLPPPLSVQVVLWMNDPALAGRDLAAAGALVQLGLVVLAILLWRAAEWAGRHALVWLAGGGHRAAWLDRPMRGLAAGGAALVGGGLAAGMAGLAVWSVAGPWAFPDILPRSLSLSSWDRALPDLAASAGVTLAIAVTATAGALVLVLGCLEAEHRFGLAPAWWSVWVLYLPLLMPQIAFLPGLQRLMLTGGLQGSALTVALAHLVFVLPYVFLSLAAPFRAWDRRVGIAAASLGASEARIFWHLRLPMLAGPSLTAAAVGMAVSIGQYLPTLLVGGGRVETVTTAAVALSSGGDRRLVGAYALLQALLPFAGFALALAVPAVLWRNRRQMRTHA